MLKGRRQLGSPSPGTHQSGRYVPCFISSRLPCRSGEFPKPHHPSVSSFHSSAHKDQQACLGNANETPGQYASFSHDQHLWDQQPTT